MNQPRNLTGGLVALAFFLGASTLASAQYGSNQYGNSQYGNTQPQWGRPTAPRSGACFYRDPNFRGPYFCARSGENVATMSRGMNDRISSIRTFGATEVTIFQDVRYAGRWTRLEGDVRDLRREGWNDRLSSIRVNAGDWRDLAEYGGRYGDRQNGSGLGRIETAPWRDDRSDQRDGSGYNPRDSAPNRYPTDGRTGAANGGRSVETVDVTVRRVYQEVLLRDADPQGLALYRNHVNNDRWSEQDVRSALLQSPEYRQRTMPTPQVNAEQLVARAYRSVLGRDPDPASRVYVDKVLRERWTEADVTRELKNSPEYRSKHQ